MNRPARFGLIGRILFFAAALALLLPGCKSDTSKAVTLTASNFDQVVLNSKQPVLVDFWMDGCPPCEAMDPIIRDLAAEFEGRAVVGKLKFNDYPEIAKRYGIDVFPTYLAFNAGELRKRFQGMRPKQYLRDLVREMLEPAPSKALTLSASNFDEIVLQNSQPVLVDFWAEWCGPCRQMDPVIRALASEFEGRAVVAKLNVDDYQEIAKKYDIQYLPTYLVFQAGEPKQSVSGMKPKQFLRDLLGSMQ